MNVQDFPHQLVHFRGAPGQLVLQLVQERSTTVVRPVQEPAVQLPQEFPGPDGFAWGEERIIFPQSQVNPSLRRGIRALYSIPIRDSGAHHSPRSGVTQGIPVDFRGHYPTLGAGCFD